MELDDIWEYERIGGFIDSQSSSYSLGKAVLLFFCCGSIMDEAAATMMDSVSLLMLVCFFK